MILIGEKLNSSIPQVKEALESRDRAFLLQTAKTQIEAGADYLDINAALLRKDETAALLWATEEILKKFPDAGIMIDTPMPGAAEAVLSELQPKNAIINSITLESARFSDILALAKLYRTKLVCLPITDEGIPEDTDTQFKNTSELITKLREGGMDERDLFIDVLFRALSVDHCAAKNALTIIQLIKDAFPSVNITGGLSNISFGLPNRIAINTSMLIASAMAGITSIIADVAHPAIRYALAGAKLARGEDEYCLDYISLYRELS